MASLLYQLIALNVVSYIFWTLLVEQDIITAYKGSTAVCLSAIFLA